MDAIGLPSSAQALDESTLTRHFGGHHDLLPLWMAEPGVALAPPVIEALAARAGTGWYGYEVRPPEAIDAFWSWMRARHSWDGEGLEAKVSPSVGTSIGVAIDQLTEPGDGVILQPPVFTDFKTLVASAGREPVKNPLVFTGDGYRMDLEGLDAMAVEPSTRLLLVCNPHNPVGRAWTCDELTSVAHICADHDVFVLADEIHADLALPPARFTPFSVAAAGSGVRWAATHGPIKTFGLAGVCDTLLIVGDAELAARFTEISSQIHLTRNNVFSIAAFEAGYRHGGPWLDELLELVSTNIDLLTTGLPDGVDVIRPEGTYLAWLDFRRLGMEVPELADWLSAEAGLALSPGHWFGREGAGFARMTVAAPSSTIEAALERLSAADSRR